MNNIIENRKLRKGSIKLHWQIDAKDPETGKPISELYPIYPEITKLLLQNPKSFGASKGEAISQGDLIKISKCWYPVHAMGYNFIQSNAISAKTIAERIRGLVEGYNNCGFKCDEIILVTHSMGGLLARALIHPKYGNLTNKKEINILGIYHNVMPTVGAGSAYKRMRFGFKETWGPINTMTAEIFGIDGKHATAILANAPAPLEMLPGMKYGLNWLKVINKEGKLLYSWPNEKESALESIYLQPEKKWWRLLNPDWVNPANLRSDEGGGIDKVRKRIETAFKFSQSIESTFHEPTYASYCGSKEYPSYGEVVFKVIDGLGSGLFDFSDKFIPPSPEKWTLVSDDAKGEIKVKAGSRTLTLKLQKASDPGDETVPLQRSASHTKGGNFFSWSRKKHRI